MAGDVNTRIAHSLWALFRAAGVKHAIICPGARSAPLAYTVEDIPGLQAHAIIDERAAGFFALGLGRSEGLPAVVVSTSGSAGAHFLPALLEARHDHVPMIVITADRPGELQDCGASQTVRQTRLFGDTVPSFSLETPFEGASDRHYPPLVARLLDAARTGPVHLNLPFREPLWQDTRVVENSPRPKRVFRAERHISHPAQMVLREMVDGKRGVFVVGPQTNLRLAEPLFRCARKLGYPVLAEPGSQCVFGLDAPELMTAAAAFLPFQTASLLPEVVLRIGRPPTNQALGAFLDRSRERLIVIEPDLRFQDPQHAAAVFLEADPVDVCQVLERTVDGTPSRAKWLELWQQFERISRDVLAQAASDGFWEATIAKAVVEALPAHWSLHLGNSSPIRDFELFGGRGSHARQVFTSRGTAGIDGGFATAAGEALGSKSPVLLCLGDVAAQHDAGGLLASRELDAPISAVVIDNQGGGIFRTLPFARPGDPRFERYFLTPPSMDLEALARAAGFAYHTISSDHGLRKALDRLEPHQILHVIVPGPESAERRQGALAAVGRALEHLPKGHDYV